MQSVGALQEISKKEKAKQSCILLVAGSAGDLPGEDVEGLGCCKTAAAIGEGHGDGVGCSRPKFSVH